MILSFFKRNIFVTSIYSAVYKDEINKYFLVNIVSVKDCAFGHCVKSNDFSCMAS